MFREAIEDLQRGEVITRHGCAGAINDVYYDGACWQVRYLLLGASSSQLVLSVACLGRASPPRERMLRSLSRASLEGGALPAAMVRDWLQCERLSSGRETLGMRVLARDGAFGRVSDLLVDDEHWSIDYLVVEASACAGGRLLVPLDWVAPMDRPSGAVHVRRTRSELHEAALELRVG